MNISRSTRPSKNKPAKMRRRTQEERTAEMTARIMAAARDCLFECGYAGATMSAIAKRAGVTRGALQHHYGSHAEVLKALIDFFFESLPKLNEPSPDTHIDRDIEEFLSETFRVYGSRIALAILEIRIGARATPSLRDEIEKKFLAMDPPREKIWRQLFRRAGLTNVEADSLREVIYAILRGLAVRQAYVKSTYSLAAEQKLVMEMVFSVLGQRERPARK